MATYRLAYESAEELVKALNLLSLQVRDTVRVRINGGTDYVFHYMGVIGDQVTGLSSLNGKQVILDIEALELHEHDA